MTEVVLGVLLVAILVFLVFKPAGPRSSGRRAVAVMVATGERGATVPT